MRFFAVVAYMSAVIGPAPGYAQDRGIGGPAENVITPVGGPIGLRVRFNRADPTYAIGEVLGLTIVADRTAAIEIWELEPGGALNKILPRPGQSLIVNPGQPLTLPQAGMNFRLGGPEGVTELHVIARAGPQSGRSIASADARLAGQDGRQDQVLRYRIVSSIPK